MTRSSIDRPTISGRARIATLGAIILVGVGAWMAFGQPRSDQTPNGAQTNQEDTSERARERASRIIRLSWFQQERDRLDLSDTWYNPTSMAIAGLSGVAAAPAAPAPTAPAAPAVATPSVPGGPIAVPGSIMGGPPTTATVTTTPNVVASAAPTGTIPKKAMGTFVILSSIRGGPASIGLADGVILVNQPWKLEQDGSISIGGAAKIGWAFEGSRNRVRFVGGPFGESGEVFERVGEARRNAIVRNFHARRMNIERAIAGHWIGRSPFVGGGEDVLFYFDPWGRPEVQPRFRDPDNWPVEPGFQQLRQGTPYRSTLFVRTLDGRPLLQKHYGLSQLGIGFQQDVGGLPEPLPGSAAQANGYYPVDFDLANGRIEFDGEAMQLRRLTKEEYREYVIEYRAKRRAEILRKTSEELDRRAVKPYRTPATPVVEGGTSVQVRRGPGANAPAGRRGPLPGARGVTPAPR